MIRIVRTRKPCVRTRDVNPPPASAGLYPTRLPETIQNFTPPRLTISSVRSLGDRWSCFVPRISLVRPIARDIGDPRDENAAASNGRERAPEHVLRERPDHPRQPESGNRRNEADTFKPLHHERMETPGPRGRGTRSAWGGWPRREASEPPDRH